MSKKNREYWEERFLELENSSNEYALEIYKRIERAFYIAQKETVQAIESWLSRFAKNNNITMQEARKWLNNAELKELKWSVQEYIKYGRENAINQAWLKELENVSSKVHISRYEALMIHMQQSIEKVFHNELDMIDTMARKVYEDNYYKTIYEVQKGFNVGWQLNTIDTRKLDKIVNVPWASDGKVFSERIWINRQQLANELQTQLVRMCLIGNGPDKAIKEIAKRFDVSKKRAGALVMTEEAYFHSAAQKDAFEELDAEEYEIVATLDNRTSQICRDMDLKHFPMKEYKPGVTAPPFHVRCRSVTVPYFDDEFSLGERAARDEDGKISYVSSDMSYHEWYKEFVENNPQAIINEKKIKNKYSDSKQFEKYKEILGEDAPKTFADFQELKYNNNKEYEELKKLYKEVDWQIKAKENIVTGSEHKVPFNAEPNSVFDNYKDGKITSRRYYGKTGKPRLDIDLTDHGNPTQHVVVPHQHNWLKDESNHDDIKRPKDSPLTKAHKIANKDILKGD